MATGSTEDFELEGDDINFLPSKLDKFLETMCAEDSTLMIDLKISSENAGDNKQSIAVPIKAVKSSDSSNSGSSAALGINIPTGSADSKNSQSGPQSSSGGGRFQGQERKVDPLKLTRLSVSPTGLLSMRFSKPVLVR